tara:strand:+ start:3309 stop:3608 length:300 start_codon:yes stop_codon:yes gene_type:complete
MAKVFTANRLVDGAVVYLDQQGVWTTDVLSAHLLESDEAIEKAEAAGRDAVARHHVVDAYPIDAELRDDSVYLTRFRERIRAQGPTILFGTAGLKKKAA